LSPLAAILLGLSGALLAQDAVENESTQASKAGSCSTAAIIEAAHQSGHCAVEKGANYTKISRGDRIVALLPENISNPTRCQEVLESVKKKCGDENKAADENAEALNVKEQEVTEPAEALKSDE
jgi:hypothetical protein